MRHNVWIQLLGSASLALLIGLWLQWAPGTIGVTFVFMAVGWGCTTSARDAWHRWQTQGNPRLLLGLAWNIGLAGLVWALYAYGWGLVPGLGVLLSYAVLPWGLGCVGWLTYKRWHNAADRQHDALV